MLKYSLGLALISISSLACTDGEGFLPPNSRKYPVDQKTTGLTVEQYHEAIDKVLKVYSPIAKSYGASIDAERLWESETVNAGTIRRDNGKKWVLRLYGGFARHPHISQDGYMLVICHEIGHHIGGAPKKYYPDRGTIWASTEGQSDYFATLKCLRKVFARDNNQEIIRTREIPDSIRSECQLSFTTDGERALCVRTGLAGISVAAVNADIRRAPLPDIEDEDTNVVDTTYNAHPEPQCRLNTYFAGAICPVPSYQTVSQINEVKGTCHPKLDYTRGLRPPCWYRPKE